MQKQIIRRESKTGPCDFSADLPELLARIYSARNVSSDKDLNRQLKGLHHYTSSKILTLPPACWPMPLLPARIS